MPEYLRRKAERMAFELKVSFNEACSILGKRGNKVKAKLAAQRKTPTWKKPHQLTLALCLPLR